MKSAKVLILDDSILMRELLTQELEVDPNIHVVAKASNPYEARDKIIEVRPDIMIADVHMSAMDGLEFLRQLLPQYYLPTIIISSDVAQEQSAKDAGAVAFVAKPEKADVRSREVFVATLSLAIKNIVTEANEGGIAGNLVEKCVAIGASTGGAEAVETILKSLPVTVPPIVIGQHMPAKFTQMFAERLNRSCAITVKEGVNGEILRPGTAYIAPGGYHMSMVKRSTGYYLECMAASFDNTACPNIDILFSAVAKLPAGYAWGAILTGMGRDGAEGLLKMKQAGHLTVAQDKDSSVVYGMPKAAFENGAADKVLPLKKIATEIIRFSQRS